MNIERNQGQHNAAQININNNAGSADDLQQSALLIASGRNLGMSDEQILAQVSRMNRREAPAGKLTNRGVDVLAFQQANKTLVSGEGKDLTPLDEKEGRKTVELRRRTGRAVFDDEFTEEDRFQGRTDIEEGFRTESGERYIADESRRRGRYVDEDPPYSPEAKDTRRVELFDIDKQGNRTGYHETPTGILTGRDRVRPEEDGTALQLRTSPESSYNSRTGEARGPVGDALKRVQRNDRSSRFSPEELAARRARVFGPGVSEVVTEGDRKAVEQKLIESLDVRVQKEKEQAEVAELVARVGASRDPEKVQQVQAQAEIDALKVLKESGFAGAEDYSDLGTVQDRPLAGVHQRENGSIYYTDERGVPIVDTESDIELLLRGDPNKADTAQTLNVARPQSAPSWIIDNQPDNYPSETSFGNYPQTDVALAKTTFANKVRELSGVDATNINLDIRTAADLQRVQQAVEEQRRARGQAMFIASPDGKQVLAEKGDIRGLMHALKMTGPEQRDLANALAMEALSNEGDRPTEATRIMGVNPDENGVDSNVAKVPANSTIKAEGGKRRNIRAELAQLEGADAQQPFIGAVIDERTGKQETDAGPRARNQFKPGNMGDGDELESNLRRQAISRVKPGQKLDRERLGRNIGNARRVEAREAADAPTRAERMSSVIASLPPAARSTRLPGTQFSEASRDVSPVSGSKPPEKLYGFVDEPGGALVSLRKPESAKSEAPSSYYDGSSENDVASRMASESAGIRKRAQQKAEISERLKREILGRAVDGQNNRRNRIKQGLAVAAGAGTGVAGLNDIFKGDEGLIRY